MEYSKVLKNNLKYIIFYILIREGIRFVTKREYRDENVFLKVDRALLF